MIFKGNFEDALKHKNKNKSAKFCPPVTLASNLTTEGLGAPSQNTSLLGGVTQILIFPRPSPRLSNVGLFV